MKKWVAVRQSIWSVGETPGWYIFLKTPNEKNVGKSHFLRQGSDLYMSAPFKFSTRTKARKVAKLLNELFNEK